MASLSSFSHFSLDSNSTNEHEYESPLLMVEMTALILYVPLFSLTVLAEKQPLIAAQPAVIATPIIAIEIPAI